MQNKRILINWQVKATTANNSQAILLNSFGQTVSNQSINANLPTFMSMAKRQTGIYSIAIMQDNNIVAQEKVIWTN